MNIRKSLLFSYLDRYASLAVAIGSSMAIARLLTPEDIGVYSVTMILLTFVATVRDMGAGNYLVQEKELTVERVRAVWAVQLGLGVLLALAVLIAAVPVALFYHQPRMRDIMFVIAVTYLVNPFGSLTYAWQIREMRFDTLALVRFCATVTGAIVSIVLAWRHVGPISLAYGSLASTLVNALMAVHFRPSWFPWLPGTKEIRRVLAYGSQSTGAAMISTIAANASELLLGKLQGMTATGLFSRASGLVMMFDRLVLTGISSVAVSWFARQSREHGSIAQPYLKATAYVTAAGAAFCLGLICLTQPAMRLLYGDQWDGAVMITRFIALGLLCGLPSVMCIPALMALGRAKEVLRGEAVTTAFTVVLLAIGAVFGMVALGSMIVFATVLRTWYWLRLAHPHVDFSWSQLLREQAQSAAVGVGAALGPALAFFVFGGQPATPWASLALGVPTGLAGFVGAIVLVGHPLREEFGGLMIKVRSRFA